MKTLIVLNDPPYGTERSYNGLRLALELAKRPDNDVRVFLMADAVGCALTGQITPTGYYNIERMIKGALQRGAQVSTCGTCMDARGFNESQLVAGVTRGTMEQLGDWHCWADKVSVF